MIASPRLKVVFYKSSSGKEPVREWLKSLPRNEKKIIGEDIKTVQYSWPIGLPIVRKLGAGLWEVRSFLENRTARLLFTVHNNLMVLLHGFIKKSQKTAKSDLELAKRRAAEFRN